MKVGDVVVWCIPEQEVEVGIIYDEIMYMDHEMWEGNPPVDLTEGELCSPIYGVLCQQVDGSAYPVCAFPEHLILVSDIAKKLRRIIKVSDTSRW